MSTKAAFCEAELVLPHGMYSTPVVCCTLASLALQLYMLPAALSVSASTQHACRGHHFGVRTFRKVFQEPEQQMCCPSFILAPLLVPFLTQTLYLGHQHSKSAIENISVIQEIKSWADLG